MPIQFDNVPPNFLVNMDFTLPSIFKSNLGQPKSFDDDFEGETKAYDLMITKLECPEYEDVDIIVRRTVCVVEADTHVQSTNNT